MRQNQRFTSSCAAYQPKASVGAQEGAYLNVSSRATGNSRNSVCSSIGHSGLDSYSKGFPCVQIRRMIFSDASSHPSSPLQRLSSPSTTVVAGIVSEIEHQLKSHISANPDKILSLLKQV